MTPSSRPPTSRRPTAPASPRSVARSRRPGVPLTVFVADDPDRAWAEIGEYLMVDASSYAQWNAHRQTASVSFAATVDELKSERGEYQIITPEEASSYVARGIPLALQPLVGGIPPDIAWRYLETAAAVCS